MPDWKQYVREHLPPLRLAGAREQEVIEELAQQLEDCYSEVRAQGAAEEDAAARATGQFPDWAAVAREIERAEQSLVAQAASRAPETWQRALAEDSVRKRRGGNMFADFLQDVRHAFRSLRKAPGFTAVIVLTLALGIGANSTIFSVVNAVLLRPLPFPQPARIVLVRETYLAKGWTAFSSSPANFVDWRTQNHSFDHLAAYLGTTFNYNGGDAPEQLTARLVTAGYLEILGAQAQLGRTFTEEEFQPGHDHVLALSDGAWKRLFGSDPGALNKTILLDRQSYAIIGVISPAVSVSYKGIDFWAPLAMKPQMLISRGAHYLTAIGRLKTGVSIDRAQAEMTAIAARLAQQFPNSNTGWGAAVTPLTEAIVGDIRKPLLILLGAVSFVLLIACANVANMLLVRSAARRREFAIRTALGAGRARLVRQFVTESVLLALLGGAFGLLLAFWGARAIPVLNPGLIPRAQFIHVDAGVLVFTFVVAVLTGVCFGLVPALSATRLDLHDTLKEGGRGVGGSVSRHRGRSVLVVTEVALALMLLVGAGLLIQSFSRLTAVSPGFRTDHALLFTVSRPATTHPPPPETAIFFDDMLERLRAFPGVESAATTSMVPLIGADALYSFWIEGEAVLPSAMQPSAIYYLISPGYFRTMGIPLIAGRDFQPGDSATSQHVCIINERMAREFFPKGSPIGRRLHIGRDERIAREVVGVVRATKHYALGDPELLQVYEPLDQFPLYQMRFVVRTAGDPIALASSARQIVRSLDPQQPVTDVQTFEERLGQTVALPRFHTLLLSLFAGLALVLAAVGLYGVMSYSVAQRTQEIGVRMALGAQRRDVYRLVVGQGMLLAVTGTVLGLSGAFALTRLLKGFLFEVKATDPVTYLAVSLLLVGVAALACFVPARRASRVDPLIALRHE